MNKTLRNAAVLSAFLATGGCVGVGVDGDVGVGYTGGYYEPYGYDYGGWGPGYGVGPWHGHDHDWHGGERPGGGRAPSYHPPAGGRSMPGLPGGGRPRGR